MTLCGRFCAHIEPGVTIMAGPARPVFAQVTAGKARDCLCLKLVRPAPRETRQLVEPRIDGQAQSGAPFNRNCLRAGVFKPGGSGQHPCFDIDCKTVNGAQPADAVAGDHDLVARRNVFDFLDPEIGGPFCPGAVEQDPGGGVAGSDRVQQAGRDWNFRPAGRMGPGGKRNQFFR